ncbi:MAG: NUDIX hydrolase [Nitrososphaeraceae archaeon]|jgi:ADP-ribose pyrophosphatase
MAILTKNRGLSEDISIVESKRVYSGDVCVRLDKLIYNQKIINEEVVEHSASVGIIPITDTNEIFLVLQYRHAIGKTLLEIPAGKIERGESPEQAAVREMTEEIGHSGNVFPFIQLYLAPGYDTELMYVFIARDLKIEKAIADDNERIIVKRLKITEAIDKALNGEIVDSKTVASILCYWERYSSRK